jgi:hypothetical protein
VKHGLEGSTFDLDELLDRQLDTVYINGRIVLFTCDRAAINRAAYGSYITHFKHLTKMLNELQPDLRELIQLVREIENFDATITAARNAGKPIEPQQPALEERQRKGHRIVELQTKWGL